MAALLLVGPAATQTETQSTLSDLPAHPRILLPRGEEAAIRQMVDRDATWQKLHRTILAECDQLDQVAPVERIQIGRRLLDKSRECLRRVF